MGEAEETTHETPETAETADLERTIDEATEAVAIQARELEELSAEGASGDPMGLGHLLDVLVKVTVQVGRARLSLRELVDLAPGSLVTLDRKAHEPADILVNGKVVARGEVVTIGDAYGVRITSVVAD